MCMCVCVCFAEGADICMCVLCALVHVFEVLTRPCAMEVLTCLIEGAVLLPMKLPSTDLLTLEEASEETSPWIGWGKGEEKKTKSRNEERKQTEGIRVAEG